MTARSSAATTTVATTMRDFKNTIAQAKLLVNELNDSELDNVIKKVHLNNIQNERRSRRDDVCAKFNDNHVGRNFITAKKWPWQRDPLHSSSLPIKGATIIKTTPSIVVYENDLYRKLNKCHNAIDASTSAFTLPKKKAKKPWYRRYFWMKL